MRKRWKLAVFVLFLVADLMLVAYMFREIRDDRRASGATEPVPTSTSSPTPQEEEATGVVRLAARGDIMVRSHAGSCRGSGRPLLELSRDGGKTFNEVAVPVLEEAEATDPESKATPIRTIVDVAVESPLELEIIAGDEKCKPRRHVTEDGGDSWERKKSFDAWFVDASGKDIVSPDGVLDAGCEVASLSQLSDAEAKVVCRGGAILETEDSGATWLAVGDLDKTVKAAIFTRSKVGFAIAGDGTCSRTFSTEDGGLTWQTQGCVKDVDIADLAGTVKRLVVADDKDVRVSTDEGKSWTAP